MKYQENLRFSHPLLWLTMLPVLLLFGYGIFRQMVQGKPFGNHPAHDHWLIFFALLVVLVMLLIHTARLRFCIDEQGIHYRFFPFHFKTRHIGRDAVEKVHVKAYDALSEFGGWGIRINFRDTKTYNVMGDHGQAMEVIKTNGKRVLFSTYNPQALSRFLQELSAKGVAISLHN